MALSSKPSGRTGRRPGATDTREAIAHAARTGFAELGYDRTTIRGIAKAAGVDPALVLRFYGPKEELFRTVMSLPPDAADAIAALGAGPRATIGRRLAEIIVAFMENPQSRAILLGRIRSSASHPVAAELVRETVTRDLGRLARALTDDRPDTRAVLVGAHIVGIALARYAVEVEPLKSIPAADLVDYLTPTFQALLTGPLAAD